jgi:hypothetical protein
MSKKDQGNFPGRKRAMLQGDQENRQLAIGNKQSNCNLKDPKESADCQMLFKP